VGACIVDERNKIVGIGYNGFPAGCSDDILPWAREADNVNDTKYPYVVHAEVNAILNSTKTLYGARLYVALFPCNECAKVIIQSGIVEVIYLSDKYGKSDSVMAAKKMFSMSGVKFRQLNTKLKGLSISFEAEQA
jgi:dCMP deaminase